MISAVISFTGEYTCILLATAYSQKHPCSFSLLSHVQYSVAFVCVWPRPAAHNVMRLRSQLGYGCKDLLWLPSPLACSCFNCIHEVLSRDHTVLLRMQSPVNPAYEMQVDVTPSCSYIISWKKRALPLWEQGSASHKKTKFTVDVTPVPCICFRQTKDTFVT